MSALSVTVSAKRNGERIEIQVDPETGQLLPAELSWGDNLILTVDTPPSWRGFGVEGSANRKITWRRNLAATEADHNRYRQTIPLGESLNTRYPGNCVQVLEVTDGRLRVHRAAIVSWNGELFLVTITPIDIQLYSEDNHIVAPTLTWNELVEALADTDLVDVTALPPLVEYRPVDKPDTSSLAEGTGMVLYFDIIGGRGAVQMADMVDPVRVVRMHLPQQEGRLSELTPGQIVTGALKSTEDLPGRKTEFGFQLEDVRVVVFEAAAV
jgi:hypothetical protein